MLDTKYEDVGRERGQQFHLVASHLSPGALGQGLLHSAAGCLVDFHEGPSDLQKFCGRSWWPNRRLSRAALVSKRLPAAPFHGASRCSPEEGKPGLAVTALSWEESICHRVTA